MKRTLFIFVALLMFTGCDVDDLTMGNGIGKPVRLTVNTYYETGPKTRTSYSGEFIGTSPQYERIDWVNSDLLHVWEQLSDANASGDYKVTSHDDDGKNSVAQVETYGTPLTWLDYGLHTFYALYPSPATTTVDDTKVTLNKDVITATIPATQEVTAASGTKVFKPDMDYAYMWAATTAETGSEVSLDFKPLMTAFEFTVKSAGAPFQLASFVLSTDNGSPYIAGDFTAKVSADLATCPVTAVANGSRSITVDLGDVEVSATAPVTFTIFALPWELKNLTMQFNIVGGITKKLDLKQRASASEPYEFVTFAPGKKYRITNVGVPSSDGWTYFLTEVQPGTAMDRYNYTAGTATKGMKSYRTNNTTGEVEEVAMKFRYSPADDDGNCTNEWSEILPDWLESLLVGEHSGTEQPDDPFTLTGTYTAISQRITTTINNLQTHTDNLRGKGERGSENAPYDLSRYDITNLGTRRAGGVKTANCYVVDRAGWYMFPLVYGNAIDCEKGLALSNWNVNSFSADGLIAAGISDGSLIKSPLLNYVNGGISTPYILDDTGLSIDNIEPVIVWEDVASSDAFITTIAKVPTPNTDAVYKDADGNEITVPYIKFYVDRATIREGNALLAIRDASQRIIWSWHIWIVDEALTTNTLETLNDDPALASNNMLSKPLGTCDDEVETGHFYDPRKCFVEVTQVQGNATPVIFEVTQHEDPYFITKFSQTLSYQWGRKDPFITYCPEVYSRNSGNRSGYQNPLYCGPTTNKESHSPAGYTITISDSMVPMQTSSDADNFNIGIQNPYIMYYGGWGDWYGKRLSYRNLWNMCEYNGISQPSNDDTFHKDWDRKVYKTVYDPCPPGFSVPNYSAFSRMTEDGGCYNVFGSGAQLDKWNFAGSYEQSMTDGSYYYSDAAKTNTIFIPNTACRWDSSHSGGGIGGGGNYYDAFYATCKTKGDRYSTSFTKTGMWIPPGPVAEVAKEWGIAVLPAEEK